VQANSLEALAQGPFQASKLFGDDRRVFRLIIGGRGRIELVEVPRRVSPVRPDEVAGTVNDAGCQIAFEAAGHLEPARQLQQGQENVVDNVLGDRQVTQQTHRQRQEVALVRVVDLMQDLRSAVIESPD
jgi:hypothetical protein